MEPQDIPFLYTLATEGETAARRRYRGATPDPQAFAAQLWADLLAQFVIERVFRRLRTAVGDILIDIDRFCATLAEALDLDPAAVQPDLRLIEDLGVDSLRPLILQDLMERDARITEFDLSHGLGTVREAHMLYVTAASVPPRADLF